MEKKITSIKCACGTCDMTLFLGPSECFQKAPYVLDIYESCGPRTAFFVSKESIEQLISDLGRLLKGESSEPDKSFKVEGDTEIAR